MYLYDQHLWSSETLICAFRTRNEILIFGGAVLVRLEIKCSLNALSTFQPHLWSCDQGWRILKLISCSGFLGSGLKIGWGAPASAARSEVKFCSSHSADAQYFCFCSGLWSMECFISAVLKRFGFNQVSNAVKGWEGWNGCIVTERLQLHVCLSAPSENNKCTKAL